MPIFSFRGFTSLATIALTIDSTVSAGWSAALAAPTITVDIARFDGNTNDELVAPVAIWFTSTNIQGARGVDGQPISEPPGDTNVYDPTALELFHSWGFGDPGYVPLVPSNVPAHMRDLNRAYAKRPCHVFHSPGPKTVNLFVYDTQGGWGTATFVFGPGGQAPAIADPATHFTGRRVYFSAEGNFTSVPAEVPLADRVTTVAAANSRLTALWNGGVTFARLDMRRGEVYTFLAELGGFRNLYVSCYGDPQAAPPKHVMTSPMPNGDGVIAISNGATGFPRIVDIDFEAPYDAATETGRRCSAVLTNSGRNGRRHLYHRVRVSGFTMWDMVKANDVTRVISDCLVTNWQDYGIYAGDGARLTLAILGGDLAQKVDALSGTHHGTGNSNFANLTSRHGPIRHNTTRDLYVAGTSFFSRNGWSQRSSPAAGNTMPGTLAQACYRHGASEVVGVRSYSTWERCSFEGGAGSVHFVDLSGADPSTNYQGNVLFDSNLCVASVDTETLIIGKGRGMAARNNILVVPGVPHATGSPQHERLLDWRFDGALDPTGPSKVFVFSNTGYILATNAQLGGSAARTLASIAASHVSVQESNALIAPNLSPALGGDLGPITTPAIAGFTPRFLGTRFNFPPIGHPSMTTSSTPGAVLQDGAVGNTWYLLVENLREGGVGPVADQEWISVPYPNYTGRCNGVLGQVTRSMVESALPGGGTRYHQVSLHNQNVKAAAPTAAGGDGRVAFAFTDTAIRVQNLSGVTWSGPIWVLLDLRDRLMGFVPGTANPATIPVPVPSAGSPLRLASRPPLWPAVDWRGVARDGMRQPGGAVQPGTTHVAGALAGAPA